MKSAALSSVLLAGAALAATTHASTPTSSSTKSTKSTGCNADNCARAVTGTLQGAATTSAHMSDCRSFLQCTAYPATSTLTATITVFPVTQTTTVYPFTRTLVSTVATVATTGATVTNIETIVETSVDLVSVLEPLTTTVLGVRRRFQTLTTQAPANSVVCPSRVPSYASACSGTARFSSACSCWGVTGKTTTMTTPLTTVTVTATGQTTVTATATQVVTEGVTAVTTVTNFVTLSTTVLDILSVPVTVTKPTLVTVVAPTPSGNAYCENGQPVDGLSASCTAVGCSTTNLRIEGASDTIYEGTILSGPRNITTASGGTHLCDGTNNRANPTPFANGISTIDAAGGLCGFTYDGSYSSQFQDFFIQRIGGTASNANQFWGILLNYQFTPAGGCETEVHPTDELLWAFNAFNVNFFLRVQPTQTPVVLAPGQSTIFTVQGSSGNGGSFQNIAGALFNGQTSDPNGNVPFTAPTTPGTYRYKATRSDSIRSNAVTVFVQG